MKLQNGQQATREAALYPYTSLASALKVSEAVKELGGARSEVQKSILASHLKDSEKSASFQQKIAGAKAFGLIDGRGSFVLTPTAQRYYFPTTESERALALIEVVAFPTAFRDLIKRFDGAKLPVREIISNLLHRELQVPDSWKDRVAAFFENSARLAGVIDTDGFVRYNASMHRVKSNSETISSTSASEVSSSSSSSSPTSLSGMESQSSDGTFSDEEKRTTNKAKLPGHTVFVFPYKGSYIRIETPENMSPSLWGKLRAYVDLLKPDDDEESSKGASVP